MDKMIHHKKPCNKCGEMKRLKEYYKNSTIHDGHGNTCKACTAIRQRKYYVENREKILHRQHRKYVDNHEVMLQYNRTYYKNNAEHKREMGRTYYAKAKEKRQEQSRISSPQLHMSIERQIDAID